MTQDFTELVTDTEATDWTQSEFFVNSVIDLALAYGQLSGKVTAIDYDLKAGNGQVVNVPYVATAAYSCTSIAPCGAASQVSATLGNYPITIYQYAHLDNICNFSEWKSKPNIQAAVMNEMAKKMANCRDIAVWSDLLGATAGYTATTAGAWSGTSRPTDSCCNYAFDIYNCIIDCWVHLRGAGYKPDYVLIHPYAAAYLYYKENGNLPAVQDYLPMVKHNADGTIATIAGMKVVEVGVAVTDDSSPSDTGDELAFVIDSSRALGEAWGMRPKFNVFYQHIYNKTEVSLWSYWGHALMEANAVAEVVSV